MVHPPFPQRAERRAEAERCQRRFVGAHGDFRGSWLPLWVLNLVSWTGAGLDVEVLQDVVVDLGGNPLLLQHLPDGLVCRVGPDRLTPLPGSSRLSLFTTGPK